MAFSGKIGDTMIRLPLFSACLLLARGLSADAGGVGTTSANFLKLGSSSRPAAMGEAYVALADDAGGLAYNPAGMLSMAANEVQATHTAWFKGANFEGLNLVKLLSPITALGFSFSYVNLPTQQLTQAVGNGPDPLQNFKDVGRFAPFDLHGAVAYARTFGSRWKTGGRLNVTRQGIGNAAAMGLGVDLGMQMEFPAQNLRAGLALHNMGFAVPLLKESFGLPFLGRLGLSWGWRDRLLLAAEADLPNDNSFAVGLGMEANIDRLVFFRMGWRMDNIFNPLSLGMGFKMSSTMLDVVWVPAGELGHTYRLSLAYLWGGPGALQKGAPAPEPVVAVPNVSLEIAANSLDPAQPDTLFVSAEFKVLGLSGPFRWRMEVSNAEGQAFQVMEGQEPEIRWTGFDDQGNRFTSNTNYSFKLSLVDAKGQVVKQLAPITKRCVFRW